MVRSSMLVAGLSAAIAGCVELPSTPDVANVIGEDGDSILYLGSNVASLPPPPSGLFKLNLATGERTAVLPEFSGAGLSSYADGVYAELVSDGRYVAWVDTAAHSLNVASLADGSQQVYLDELSGDYAIHLTIDSGRLLVDASNGLLGSSGVLLFDLTTGARREISLNNSFAHILWGDSIAYFGDSERPANDARTEEVGWLDLSYAASVRLFNLATGEDVVLEPGTRLGKMLAAEDLLLWQEFKPGSFKSRIRSHHVATAKTSTLIEEFDASGDSADLVDFDGRHLLVVRQQKTRIAGQFNQITGPTALELRTLNGDSETIASMPGTLFDTEFSQVRLVTHFVVWPDSSTREMVIYDMDTKVTSRRPMFPE